jgi:two-component system LytT family response regulator
MKLKALIVDDEEQARERLKRLLSGNEEVEVLGEAENGRQAVEMVEATGPDLMFLDIQMPEMDGFQVIRMLTKPPLIIFVTAYDEYAIKAFEINALDYLLKPFSRERLNQAIEKALREFSGKSDFTGRIDALFRTLNEQKRYMERVAVRHEGRIFVIPVNDIDWIGSAEGAIYIHTKDKQYLTTYTLDEFENRLSPVTFFRAHRSAIVNLNRIKEVVPWFAGSYRVRLSSGAEIDISRNRVKELKQFIDW